MAVWALNVTGTTAYTVPAGQVLHLRGALIRGSAADDTTTRWAALTLNDAPIASWELRVAGGGLTFPARAVDGQASVLNLEVPPGETITFALAGNGAAVSAGVWGDLQASVASEPAASTTVAGLDAEAALGLLQTGDLLLNVGLLVAAVLVLLRFVR